MSFKKKSKANELSNIFVIDDNTENLRFLTGILRVEGYKLHPIKDGRTCLDLAVASPPDMILLDIMMPDMDGYKVCEHLKAKERTRNIPIVFISALDETFDKIKAFSVGGVDYIVKPFQPEEVLARVKTHLRIQQLQKELERKNVDLEQEIAEHRIADAKLKEYSERLEEIVESRTLELKKAQDEIRKKERLALLGHFSGSISHELRNPLAVIGSSAFLLKMKLGDRDQKIEEIIERIDSNVKQSTAIIESLLNLTRMEEPKAEALSLNELVLESCRASKIPDSVAVETVFPEKDVLVNADGFQIRMALMNLLKNACESMAGAGTLTITIRLPAGNRVELDIEDTGEGILPENKEKIFEPLFTTKAMGIGFGLSITKMIIEKHGGGIGVSSVPDSGSKFTISLPLTKEKDTRA